MSSAPATTEQRRSKRFRSSIDVDVYDKRGVRRGRTVDVGRHGLFVAIVDPPANRHLVQLAIHLPGGPIRAAATVARTLPGQGVGLSLFALGDDAKRRWDAYVARVQQAEHTDAGPDLAPRSSAGAPSFLLRLKTMQRLREYLRQHVEVGGTVLFTPVLVPAGARVFLLVVHPDTQEEFALAGVVHRAVTQPPKRLEIVFQGVDLDAFRRFVDTGHPIPVVEGEPSVPPTSAPNTSPPTAPSAASEPELDIDIEDGVAEDPINWDLRTSQLPVVVGRELPVTREDEPAVSDGFDISVVDGDADDTHAAPAEPDRPASPANGDADVHSELLIDDTRPAIDPGLRPTPLRISCDRCDAEPYVVELGPCAGILGLVADLVPFVSPSSGRVVSAPRLVSAEERRARWLRYNARGGAMDDVVALASLLAAADLAAEPHDHAGASLRTSRAIERLAISARRVIHEDVVAPTRVRCPACREGNLVLQRA